MKIPIDQIDPNPDQPRKKFDRGALEELAASIREIGLVQSVLVRPMGDRYQLIAGERRWRACQMAGLSEIDATVMEADDDETFIRSIAENVNRQDMTPLEESRAYQAVVDSGRTPEDVARIFGKTQMYVTIRLQYLNLIPELQFMLETGALQKGLATGLSTCSPAAQQLVMGKYNRGEFRDDIEAQRFARGLVANEAQTGLFAIEPDHVVEERRRERVRINRTLDQVRRLANQLYQLEEMDELEVARTLGQDAERIGEEVRLLQRQIKKLWVKIDRAATLHKASVMEVKH